MKRVALWILWVALVAQIAWMGIERLHSQRGWSGILYPVFVTIGFTAFALTRGHFRWIPALLRIFIGIAFVSAICDRLGLFGGPGTPGVSWGNFKNFVSYTAQVNSFLPGRAIPALAVVESFIEGGLGIAMLLGLAVRPVSLLSAAAFRLGCCDDCFPGHKFSIQLCCLRLGRRGICDRKRRCNTSQLGCASRARQTKTLYGVKRISSTKLYRRLESH